MKSKINLSGITIGAAALMVGFAGSVQAIPITRHAFTASQSARSLAQVKTNPVLDISTAANSSKSSKVKPHAGRKPVPGAVAGDLILPISDGVAVTTDQGAYTEVLLNAPLLPDEPIKLPPPTVIVVTSNGVALQNGVGVPDGGVTAALLAGSLGGLVLLRKKFKA